MVYEPPSRNDRMRVQLWGRMGSGGPPGLQNRVRAGSASLSEFDSHALPPIHSDYGRNVLFETYSYKIAIFAILNLAITSTVLQSGSISITSSQNVLLWCGA